MRIKKWEISSHISSPVFIKVLSFGPIWDLLRWIAPIKPLRLQSKDNSTQAYFWLVPLLHQALWQPEVVWIYHLYLLHPVKSHKTQNLPTFIMTFSKFLHPLVTSLGGPQVCYKWGNLLKCLTATNFVQDWGDSTRTEIENQCEIKIFSLLA